MTEDGRQKTEDGGRKTAATEGNEGNEENAEEDGSVSGFEERRCGARVGATGCLFVSFVIFCRPFRWVSVSVFEAELGVEPDLDDVDE